jgi:glutamate-1-semialdehyde 2,1-aminomutase
MNDMLRANLYLKAVLPLMEDLVEFDAIAASVISRKNLILLSAALGRNRLRESAEAVFFAGTFWSSPAPMAAALKTLTILETTDAIPKMARLGNRLKTGLEQLGHKHGYRVTVSGPPALPYLTFDDDPDLYHIQAFCRRMISRGIFLHPHHNWFICAAHTDEDIDYTLEAAQEVFPEVLGEMGE